MRVVSSSEFTLWQAYEEIVGWPESFGLVQRASLTAMVGKAFGAKNLTTASFLPDYRTDEEREDALWAGLTAWARAHNARMERRS